MVFLLSPKVKFWRALHKTRPFLVINFKKNGVKMSQETQKENTSVNLKEEAIMNYESTGAIKGVVLTVVLIGIMYVISLFVN